VSLARVVVLALAASACGAPAAPPSVDHPPRAASDAAPPPLVAATDRPPADAGASPAATGDLGALEARPLETWQLGDVEVVVALPVGARERRPVVVGVHGSRDRPEAACARWRRTLASYPFILCPKGVPYRRALAWGSPAVLAERIDRGLAALRERHGAHVAEGPAVYAGWSLGGTLGPRVVAARPGRFDPVVLVEVGHTRLDATASTSALRSGRATKVIVACATRRCAAFGKRLQRSWKPLSGSSRAEPSNNGSGLTIVDAGIGRGHVFDDRMARALGASLAASVADDPRFRGLAAALETGTGDADAGAPEPLPPEDPDEPDEAP